MSHWLIIPCNGIGNPLSTVSRFAAFRAAELLRQRGISVELLAIGQLLARLAPAMEKVAECPVAIIEGCSYKCASKLLERLEVNPAAYVYIPDVMQSVGLGRRGLDRKYLGPKGRAIVEAVAERLAECIAHADAQNSAKAARGAAMCCEEDDQR
ncbi:MAG: hypothetical protein H5T86_12095 [Armatimonadetes bacterium]|nr:hypothetical protein [Armatimonadota bacterium]